VNRTQRLVLGFFAVAWVGLVAILAVAPEVYNASLRLRPGTESGVSPALVRAVFLAALSAFLALLSLGVVRRWRWTFWLVAVAFVLGVLRVPAAALQLAGALPADGPAWYVVLQGLIGLVQLAIGLAMLAGYRRGGVWSAF
jgi:hypothetical protein